MPTRRSPVLLALLLPVCLTLTACDLLGEEAQAQAVAAKEAEGRAVGAGCRHTGRSLEDCYMLNPKASKAAVFAGWRDMDGYMRDNKIEIVPPTVQTPVAPAKPTEEAHREAGAEKAAEASASKTETPAGAGTKVATKPEAGKGKPAAAAAH